AVAAVQAAAQQRLDAAHQLGEIELARLEGAAAADREQLLGQLGGTLRRLLDRARGRARARLRAAGDPARLAEDDGQEVVEVVRDAGGQARDRLEAQGALQAGL